MVKGFNCFVWDYEFLNDEYVYGLFLSYGVFQIVNSEILFQVYDVENGWDWVKIFGIMIIVLGILNIEDLNIGGWRFYNLCKLVGSFMFKGIMNLKNGLFGMNFF